MANLVSIQSGVRVAPDHVVCVVADYERNRILVSLITGEVHSVQPNHGGTVWSTYDRIVTDLGGAK